MPAHGPWYPRTYPSGAWDTATVGVVLVVVAVVVVAVVVIVLVVVVVAGVVVTVAVVVVVVTVVVAVVVVTVVVAVVVVVVGGVLVEVTAASLAATTAASGLAGAASEHVCTRSYVTNVLCCAFWLVSDCAEGLEDSWHSLSFEEREKARHVCASTHSAAHASFESMDKCR